MGNKYQAALLISPYVEPGALSSMSSSLEEYLTLVRHHINENYGNSLTRREKEALGSMKCDPVAELPVSLWARVWDREGLTRRIKCCRFLDVRTKVQLLMFLRNKTSKRFSDLYQWFMHEIYHGRHVVCVTPKNYAVRAVVGHLDDTGGDMVVERYLFKRTTWGFNVYCGPRIVAFGEDDQVHYLDHSRDILKSLVSNKFVFETCIGVYNHLIEVS